MLYRDSHLSDAELLSAGDGELSVRRQRAVKAHLEACWHCRSRMADLERSIHNFAAGYYSWFDRPSPQEDQAAEVGLRARLAQQAAVAPKPLHLWKWAVVVPAVACVLALTVIVGVKNRDSEIVPNPRLTPGETTLASRTQVCQANEPTEPNRIPETLKRAVLAEYGVNTAHQQAYEVDFLITPELGGTAGIRNLWPQPYFGRTWNARVKDTLEDRLRKLVCSGDLDLSTAQHEIATNWVDAYKKYVREDHPM